MIKIFIPKIKSRYSKSIARGFWQSQEGKLYYDYIDIKEYKLPLTDKYYINLFYDYIDKIQQGYKQECIFYIIDNIGYIYYNRDKQEILPHKIYKEVTRQDLKTAIKEALKKYKGATVYNINKRYYIEVFTRI